jgi:uncharacterized SAM-binding protein YcdF (DUF218 family)
VVLYFGVTAVQVLLTSRQRAESPAGAILVFGTAEYDGVPSPDLRARLDEALALYRNDRARVVAVTGGRLAGDLYTEAEVSASYLRARGVPKSALIVGRGLDSYENVRSVAGPLQARGLRKILSVTDPFHEDRAMAIASSFGLSPAPDPTEDSPIRGWSTVPYFARETMAVGLGRLIGYGRLSQLLHP